MPDRFSGQLVALTEQLVKSQFPAHKIYRRDDRGIRGIESFGPKGFGLFTFHACWT